MCGSSKDSLTLQKFSCNKHFGTTNAPFFGYNGQTDVVPLNEMRKINKRCMFIHFNNNAGFDRLVEITLNFTGQNIVLHTALI